MGCQRSPRLPALLNPPSGDRRDARRDATGSLDPRTAAVVVGYGPTGRTVVRLLRDNGIEPTVIELNMDTVRAAARGGRRRRVRRCDPARDARSGGCRHAGTLILTSAGMGNGAEVIRVARELNPEIQVLARAAYLRDLAGAAKGGRGPRVHRRR